VKRSSPLAGFAPWIIFWVVASPSTWNWAVLAAFLAALILAAPAVRAGTAKSLDLASIGFFGVLTVLAVFLDPSDLHWLEKYAQAISSGVLAVVAFGSLAFVPFTEQYARESTPPEVWDHPAFKQTNRFLTFVWGVVFLLTAISGVIAVEGPKSDDDLFTWIIPLVLIVGAFKFDDYYVDRVRARTGERQPA
jgi:hypothetical protein